MSNLQTLFPPPMATMKRTSRVLTPLGNVPSTVSLVLWVSLFCTPAAIMVYNVSGNGRLCLNPDGSQSADGKFLIPLSLAVAHMLRLLVPLKVRSLPLQLAHWCI